jgi:hypothetical protein
MLYRRTILLLIAVTLLLTACGTRGIPAIREDILVNKYSVLMITSNKLSDSAKHTVGAKLMEWRNTHQIAYEWIQDLASIDETIRKSIQSKQFDYIYVIGTDLFPTALQAAEQDKDSKWSLLQDQWGNLQNTPINSDNLALWQIDPKQVDELKNNWVNQLLAQKQSVEWVTMAEYPIPSLWAPSEEADHIILLNNNGDWFNQLVHQTNLHGSNWILFHAPVDPSFVQKAKTIGVQVVDLSASLETDLNWDAILESRLTAMTQRSWNKGLQVYNAQELIQLKIK